jgi:SAM-dependent methyltransferase
VSDPATAARSFGAQAALYDRVRPGYPAAAIRALLPEDGLVVDVGAGTGKLTAALLDAGFSVTAVEPDEQMRRVLEQRFPTADVRAGVAEQLPIPDESAAAVLFGQAWHWTEPLSAAAEAGRVLVAGGILGMLWNLHDDRQPWVAELNRITGSTAAAISFPDPPPLPGFSPGHRHDVNWAQPLRRSELVELTRTWSAVSTRPPADRKAVLDRVRELVAALPAAAGSDVVLMPYRCVSYRYRRLGERPPGS